VFSPVAALLLLKKIKSKRSYDDINKTLYESDIMYINTVYKLEKWQIFQEKKKKNPMSSVNIDKKTLHSMEVIHK